MNNKLNNRERVGSVAIQQALRFFHKLTYKQVAALCNVHPRTVWNNCNGAWGVLSWEERTRKQEAIEEASKKFIL